MYHLFRTVNSDTENQKQKFDKTENINILHEPIHRTTNNNNNKLSNNISPRVILT